MHSSSTKTCVLTSGGLDSFVLLDWLLARGHEVYPVYVRCGLLWEDAELDCLSSLLSSLEQPGMHAATILELPMDDLLSEHWSFTGEGTPSAESPDSETYLPGRNILLLSKAGVFCALHDIDNIALGSLSGNPFLDANGNFLAAFGALLSQGLGRSRPFSILDPFAAMTKHQVLQSGLHLPLHLSLSCLKPGETAHCGECNKCEERKRAFERAAIPDLTTYMTSPSHAGNR